ncbi:Phospholipase a1 plip2 protein [Thalictrum thalictroides]|uniref:Phospholipase a1 plip2 protein n=1 Tax=Thalictrum thalictroides TaxID=46969 RepID=A0A7J6WGF3_THATH|nr:Phospholipase a1 plip2 protein [Thalictrum thalictroides]
MDSLCVKAGITWPPITFESRGVPTTTAQISALGRSSINNNGVGVVSNGVCLESFSANTTATTSAASSSSQMNQNTFSSRFPFNYYPLRALWTKGNDGGVLDEEIGVNEEEEEREKNGNWVLKILHVRSLWKEEEEKGKKGVVDELEEEEKEKEKEKEEEKEKEKEEGKQKNGENGGSCEEGCCVVDDDDENNVEFDRDSFSRLLRRVSLAEAKLYARMSYLGKLSYSISKIKPASLLKHHGLRFVTSSLEKKGLSTNAGKEQNWAEVQEKEIKSEKTTDEVEEQKTGRYRITALAAYHIAASAASYLQSHTRNIIPFKSSNDGTVNTLLESGSELQNNVELACSERSFVATTDSVTAVVAAKEETKQAVAKELNTACSSPCGWFICDDDQSGTRFFVIQGSESLASWQANLLFEPIQFEGFDTLVHRGIYEAAKGIYEQMLPEVRAHLDSRGEAATFRFTGHSLGGSLALLINLMILVRGEVQLSSLLPVIMFGAPSVMCGGDELLHRLGVPRSHVQAITMHRDIVPRAFSCNYPDQIVDILKTLNGNFRNHPCLQNQKLLYPPMGDILILQPEEKFSPHHHLLPSGSGLYLLNCPLSESGDPEKQLRAAKAVFFNSPHPLEILSDRSAYGSDGFINRDHDMNSYLNCVLGVIRLELNQIRKTKREHRRQVWWPLIAPENIHDGIVVGQQVPSHNLTHSPPSFSGIFDTGRESLKRFSRFIASQHMHLLVVLLFPARFLVFGTFAITQFH